MPETQYRVKISKLARRVSLRVNAKGELVIVTPRHISDRTVQGLLTEHKDWIDRAMAKLPREDFLADGNTIVIFGEESIIRYVQAMPGQKSQITEYGPELRIIATDNHKEVLSKWLHKTSKQGILARALELAEIHGFAYNKIAVRDQLSRWGSCSSSKNLNFSWRLMLAPLETMDYVIIHELAHTKQMNHSKQFWDIVEACMPDYKTHRKWLKQNGNTLHAY